MAGSYAAKLRRKLFREGPRDHGAGSGGTGDVARELSQLSIPDFRHDDAEAGLRSALRCIHRTLDRDANRHNGECTNRGMSSTSLRDADTSNHCAPLTPMFRTSLCGSDHAAEPNLRLPSTESSFQSVARRFVFHTKVAKDTTNLGFPEKFLRVCADISALHRGCR
jgi:hypothetical protein